MTWMTNLFYTETGFPQRPLSNITIPGTHDAGCYVDHLLNYFSRTQTQNIAQQLAGGIRYFDIRPYETAAHEFWTYHGPAYVGGRLDGDNGILGDVKRFMAGLPANARELVILNISHFSGFNNASHVHLIHEILQALGDFLVPHTQAQVNLFNARYKALLKGNEEIRSRVAVIYDGALDQPIEAYVAANALPAGFFKLSPKYNMGGGATHQIYLFDQYSNKAYMDDGVAYTGMVTDQMNKLNHRQNYPYTNQAWGPALGNWPPDSRGITGVMGTMHLLSWTLTPQIRAANPIPIAQAEVNPRLLPQFNGAHWNGAPYNPSVDPKVNIIYVDDYASTMYAGGAPPRVGLSMPVALSDFLNRYIGANGQVNWPGWGVF